MLVLQFKLLFEKIIYLAVGGSDSGGDSRGGRGEGRGRNGVRGIFLVLPYVRI